MLTNSISALTSNFVMWGLNYQLLDHSRIRYFLKSIKSNRPLCTVRRNIMSLDTLASLIKACRFLVSPFTFKAILLISLFFCTSRMWLHIPMLNLILPGTWLQLIYHLPSWACVLPSNGHTECKLMIGFM